MTKLIAFSFAALSLFGGIGCGGGLAMIAGTKIPDTKDNREIIKAIEKYRLAVEAKDAATILSLASKNYWEDGGTPIGSDDYGYDGLRAVLAERFQKAESVRYSLKYGALSRKSRTVSVDVFIDASYSVAGPQGSERRDMREQNRLMLEWDGQRWLFVSGM